MRQPSSSWCAGSGRRASASLAASCSGAPSSRARSGGGAPLAVTLIGLGFYMLHNTLQTNATQMSPEARGTAVGVFSAALYLGQTAGVAGVAFVVDRAGGR